MRVTGNAGELRVGYQVAAQLGPWEITPSGLSSYRFTATVLHEHAYWFTKRPLDLVLGLGGTEWAWRGVAPMPVASPPGAEASRLLSIDLTTRPAITPRVMTA